MYIPGICLLVKKSYAWHISMFYFRKSYVRNIPGIFHPYDIDGHIDGICQVYPMDLNFLVFPDGPLPDEILAL